VVDESLTRQTLIAEIADAEDRSGTGLEFGQQWVRIIKNQKDAIKGYQNASPSDCGPRKRHWAWYRDKRIKMRKKKRTI